MRRTQDQGRERPGERERTAVFWYCPKHGYVESHPDDGRDRQAGRRRRRSPSFGVCPGPYDDDLGEWRYDGCRRLLRRRVIRGRRLARSRARVRI